jgi:hypothetical protein
MEQTTSTAPNLFKHALRWGAILGGIGCAITGLLYAVDLSLLADWKIAIFLLVFFLGMVIYAGINYRKEAGGYLSYGKAFQHGYITLLVSAFISIIFQILLYHVIDPSIPEQLTDATIEKTEQMLTGFGMSGDALEKALDQARIDTPGRFTVAGLLKQFGWGFLIYAIISLITSIFVKKNEPQVM